MSDVSDAHEYGEWGKEEIGALDDGQWHSEYVAKATFDFKGNLYFADTNNRPTRLYVYRPETGERRLVNDFSKSETGDKEHEHSYGRTESIQMAETELSHRAGGA